MTDISFSRFFKLRTGRAFIDTVNGIRLGQPSRMLINTTHSITEVCYKCGFNNISNFNRIFKRKKVVRQKNSGKRTVLMASKSIYLSNNNKKSCKHLQDQFFQRRERDMNSLSIQLITN